MKTKASGLGTDESVLQIVEVVFKTLGCPSTTFDEDAKERLEEAEFRHLRPVATGGLSAVPPDRPDSHSFKLKLGPGTSQNRPFELYRVGGGRSVSVDSGSTMFIIGPSGSGVYEITAESGDHGKRFEWLFKCKLSGDQITGLPIEQGSASSGEAKVQSDPPNSATTLSPVGNPITKSKTAEVGNDPPEAQPNGRNGGNMAEHKLVRWLAEHFCVEFGTTMESVQNGAKAEEATFVRRATVYVARGLGIKPRNIATVKGISRAGNVSLMLSKAKDAYGTGVSDFANHVKAVRSMIPTGLLPNGSEGTAAEASASSLATSAPEKPKRRPYTRRVAKVGATIPALPEMAHKDHGNSTTRSGHDLLIFLLGQSNGSTTEDLMATFGASRVEVERAFGHFALVARDEDSKVSRLVALFKEVVGQQ